jgi:peptidyl-prolyl cis-trans isomerase SurA
MAVLRSLGLLLLLAASVCAAQAAERPRRSAAVAPEKAAPAPAPVPGIGIAAVVNDDVISVYDLAERMRLVMLSSNIADTPEARQRIGAQVLRGLIDEKLQLQEAKRQGVTASEAEIKKAFEQIEKQNNMRPGQLDEFLKSRGIDRNTLIQQITATLVWGKLVRRLAAQTVTVSDEEIDEAMKRVKEHAKEPESRVAEIFLAVDNPAQDEEVRRLAEKLIEQMRAGARFSAIAQQFSQSATAAVGGDMGWVRPDQLAPELGKVVANLKPGELSPPIRTGAGYYLLLVLERRNGAGGGGGSAEEPVYDIVQVVFPVAASAGEAARRTAIAEAENVRKTAKSCAEMLRIGKEKSPQLSSEGKVRLSQISPALRGIIGKLGEGEASQPIVQKNGVGVIMVCGKGEANTAAGPVTRDEVAEALVRQRLDTVARRYMRDLHRLAYVDVRG